MTDDQTYYYKRAEQELEMAQRAVKVEAVQAHCGLANLLLERCATYRQDDPDSRPVN